MFEHLHWILRPIIQPLLDVNSYNHHDIKSVWYSRQHPYSIAAYITKHDNTVHLLMDPILFIPDANVLRVPIPLERLMDHVVSSSFITSIHKDHHFYSLGKQFGICCLLKSHVNDAVKSFIVYRTDSSFVSPSPHRPVHYLPFSKFPFADYMLSEIWGPFLLYLSNSDIKKTKLKKLKQQPSPKKHTHINK